jgi:hypothetical protein
VTRNTQQQNMHADEFSVDFPRTYVGMSGEFSSELPKELRKALGLLASFRGTFKLFELSKNFQKLLTNFRRIFGFSRKEIGRM